MYFGEGFLFWTNADLGATHHSIESARDVVDPTINTTPIPYTPVWSSFGARSQGSLFAARAL